MMAASSSLGLADLAFVWSETNHNADVTLIDGDLAVDRELSTAVVISLFTDRRAEDDDIPPSGDPTDRRGWWGDQFAAVAEDRIGSRLWLLDRSKATRETALRAKEYTLESLRWLLEDRVVSEIEVVTEMTNNALLIGVGLQRPGRDPVFFRFSHVWGQEVR